MTENNEGLKANKYINKIKIAFSNGPILTAILILFFSAVLTPVTTNVTKYITECLSGISYSIPPDSFLRNEDTIKLQMNKVDAIVWKWDDDKAVKRAEGTIANIASPNGKGKHVLNFYGIKNNKIENMHTVSYSVLSDAPELEISPQKEEYKPGETITIKATDLYGINHIGWAWDNTMTTPEYSDNVTINVPTTGGIHYLYYYAKDNSQNYTSTEWEKYVIKVITEDENTITNNNKTEINNNN